MLGFVQREAVIARKPIAPTVPYVSVSLLDARSDQCKYPLWGTHEKNGLVCGAKNAHTKSQWCAHHETVVFKVPPDWTNKKV